MFDEFTPAATPASSGVPIVEMRGVGKRFGGTRALRGVSLSVRAGEVHALLGSNGSGKSTLVKVLAGLVRADEGQFEIRGASIDRTQLSPGLVHREAFRFVHQDPVVFDALTVADNLAVLEGFPHSALGRVQQRKLREQALEILYRWELDIAPSTVVGELRPAERVMVSIARTLSQSQGREHSLIVLDEPTAVLQGDDCQDVLAWIRRLASQGHGIIFVSHRLDEVQAVADRGTVLRDGAVTGVLDSDLTKDRIVELMVGANAFDVADRVSGETGARERVLRVDRLEAGPLRDVSISVASGEIVGVAGLVGSGRTTLLECIFGARTVDSGEVCLEPGGSTIKHPSDAIRAGVAYVPEDRARAGVFSDLSVVENLLVGSWRAMWRRLSFRGALANVATEDAIRHFRIVCADPSVPVTMLSGGNQQKVVLARWMRRNPRLLLLDEPTQGVDVGARASIHAMVRAAARSDGMASLVVSSDFDELVELCDRVVVLSVGTIVDELSGRALSTPALARLAHRVEVGT